MSAGVGQMRVESLAKPGSPERLCLDLQTITVKQSMQAKPYDTSTRRAMLIKMM